MDSVFVDWVGTADYGSWASVVGAARDPLHLNLLYTHLSPSSLRFRLGNAVIFKTQTPSSFSSGIRQRAALCLSTQLGAVVATPSAEHHCH